MRIATPVADAVAQIKDGAVLMVGGFMGVGTPERIIDEIITQGQRDLTVIANDTARPGVGIGKLVSERRLKKAIVSHIGTNPETQKQMVAGEMEVDLVPQGTLAERVRAAGYGLGGVLTKTGLGTRAAEGKQTVVIDGETWLIEKPQHADFALILAKEADYNGNLNYSLTATNFNPLMAMAGDVVIAEVRDFVPVGVISPDNVDTPGVIVDCLISRAA